MATKHRNLSQLNSPLPSAEEMKFGIVVAEWNPEVTEGLLSGAVHTLRSAGCPEHNIQIKYVPGTFELWLGAQFFAQQALDRSGGRLGNKGDEAAAAAIQMVHLQDEMDTEENALDRKAIN